MMISTQDAGRIQVLLFEEEFIIPAVPGHTGMLAHLSKTLKNRLQDSAVPLRLAVTRSCDEYYYCEVGVLNGGSARLARDVNSIFRVIPRRVQNQLSFNVVLIIPTGIGAEIGGHAGDGTPVARLLGSCCDTLITHPNVVTASDINEMPENSLFVEGSVVCRLLMGSIGLQRVRSNRVLVVIDAHRSEVFVNAAINSVSAARSSFGLNCPRVILLDPAIKLKSQFTSSGRAAGQVEGLEELLRVLEDCREDYDAVAISSVIDVPEYFHEDYYQGKGKMVNPWGGVEAMLTHAVSSILNIPSAHSPMFESEAIEKMDPGVVDPRMAAEAISMSFLLGPLKGLHRSPRLVTDATAMDQPNVLTVKDVSCLVIPDGCIGLPTLAALEQGIPVIAVRENKNLMRNDLTMLPWRRGQLHIVENYWEAVGVMTSIKAGLAPESVRRPLKDTEVVKKEFEGKGEGEAMEDTSVGAH